MESPRWYSKSRKYIPRGWRRVGEYNYVPSVTEFDERVVEGKIFAPKLLPVHEEMRIADWWT